MQPVIDMADKRVVAYFMHEREETKARELLRDVVATDSFLMGNIDDSELARLEQAGLVVRVVEEVPPEPLDELMASVQNMTVPQAALERAGDLPVGETTFFTCQLAGPLIEEWRQALKEAGAEILELTGPERYTLRLAPDAHSAIRELGFVLRLHPYSTRNAQPEMARSLSTESVSDYREMRAYDVRLHRAEDMAAVQAWLAEHRIAVAGASGRKLRVHLFEDSFELAQLQQRPEIAQIEDHIPPEMSNARARVILGLDPGTGLAGLTETGRGQIVAVADSGLDDQHPDFQGRILGLIALGRRNDASDPHGHGTHVAGSVLGDGAASNGEIRGAAPAAQLFFQSIMDAKGQLGGLPLDLNTLLDEAYQAGARIHNNSWSANVAAKYTSYSAEVDEFVEQHPDMTVVIAAGNWGSAHQPQSTQTGRVDWLSVGAPATSKNALTVGASRSDRTEGGHAAQTWGEVWPHDFPDEPIRDEMVSGDPQSLAAFSGRGPCDDRRIKPDVVAPGTDIVSTKSARAPLKNFWGAYPGHQSRYADLGGTSMAAPLVAGCAALVREYYVDTRQHDPSAALVKATLINGARWLTGKDAISEFAAAPNFHQGFGRVHMPWTIPNAGEPGLALSFLDSWNDRERQFFKTGARFRFRIRANAGRDLRICLAWTDLPFRALQNNLDLAVEHLDTGQKWLGNADLPLRLRLPDAENNVEVVRITAPEAGDYLLQISAGNLLRNSGQAFALVVTGDLGGDLKPY